MKRIKWIDISKFILIILVIIGHTKGATITNTFSVTQALISSFHMPCFFIISGLTVKYSKDFKTLINNTFNSFKRLIFPVLFIFIIISFFMLISGDDIKTLYELTSFIEDRLLTLLYSSGFEVTVKEKVVSEIGMLWFLISLFFNKTILDFLHLINKNDFTYSLSIILLTTIGVVVGQYASLWFSLDVSLSSLFFTYVGAKIANKNIINLQTRIMLPALCVWLSTFTIIYKKTGVFLELASRKYPLFPICYICSIGGSIFLLCFSCILEKIIEKLNRSKKIIYFFGKHTLEILIIHSLDSFVSFAWKVPNNFIIRAIFRIVIDFSCFAVLFLLNEQIKKTVMKY